MVSIASVAPVADDTLTVEPMPIADAVASTPLTEIVSLLVPSLPIWNVIAEVLFNKEVPLNLVTVAMRVISDARSRNSLSIVERSLLPRVPLAD